MAQKLNEMPCPKCRKPVSVSATRCPHCHADYSEAEIAARRREHNQTISAGCAMLVALVLGLAYCSSRDAPVDEPTNAAPEARESALEPASTQNQKLAFTELYRLVLETGKSCDSANTTATEALGQISSGKSDLYSAFSKIDDAEKLCSEAVEQYRSIEVPTVFSEAVQTSLGEAIGKCKTGYEARVSGLGTVKQVMDGDARPSVVQSFKDDQQLAQAGVMLCVAGLADAGLKLGLSADELEAAVK